MSITPRAPAPLAALAPGAGGALAVIAPPERVVPSGLKMPPLSNCSVPPLLEKVLFDPCITSVPPL